MRVLDLYCCAGGAAMGYYRAFGPDCEIVGVDIKHQKRYPFTFVQADALEYVAGHGAEFDFIHASPPCQRYTGETPPKYRDNHPDLIAPTREALLKVGKPYVIENVAGARSLLIHPLMLCGTMFGLPIFRHRYFEAPWLGLAMSPFTCKHDIVPVLITGTPRRKGIKRADPPVALRREAIGIDWMVTKELDEAIPPAYTEWLGRQFLRLPER